MKIFLHLLTQDFRLLQRYNIIKVSILVTAIYMALFYWLRELEDAHKILVLIIFNDPALIGFLFAGVMVLFEKDENTLQALAVTPLRKGQYILSKSLALSLVATACCFAMAIAALGSRFHFFHFGMASMLTTLLFSFLGFMMVAGEKGFNRFILKTLGIILALALPFLGFFGLCPREWFLWIPSQPAIDLFRAAFMEDVPAGLILYAYSALFFWTAAGFYLARKMIRKSFNN